MLLILTSLFGGMHVTNSCLNFGFSKFFLAQLLIETAPRRMVHSFSIIQKIALSSWPEVMP